MLGPTPVVQHLPTHPNKTMAKWKLETSPPPAQSHAKAHGSGKMKKPTCHHATALICANGYHIQHVGHPGPRAQIENAFSRRVCGQVRHQHKEVNEFHTSKTACVNIHLNEKHVLVLSFTTTIGFHPWRRSTNPKRPFKIDPFALLALHINGSLAQLATLQARPHEFSIWWGQQVLSARSLQHQGKSQVQLCTARDGN